MDITVQADQAARSKAMLYHVSRNGQNYGPYTLEDLHRYVASGNVLPTDLAKSDDMPEWVPVSQILGIAAPPAVAISGGPSAYGSGVAFYPDPPNLHWALLLLFTLLTCGLFLFIYDFVQAIWVTRIVPGSRVVIYLIVMIVIWILMIGAFVSQFGVMFGGMKNFGNPAHIAGPYLTITLIVYLLMLVFYWVFIEYRFTMRDEIMAHFNQHGPEPIGLKIGAAWTFFFGGLCFQYHFNRINRLKRMTRLGGDRG
jgi:GYF domain 2